MFVLAKIVERVLELAAQAVEVDAQEPPLPIVGEQ
jgi:hypothetical protein